jgi:hypothetical protein
MQVESYLRKLTEQLLSKESFRTITLTRNWASLAPKVAGVYVLKQGNHIIYVGESGNIRGRMYDLLKTVNHTVRRSIGHKHFSSVAGYEKATSKLKFPDHIELLINDFMCKKLKISYLPVMLGRKELEEYIECSIDKAIKLNKRGRRT